MKLCLKLLIFYLSFIVIKTELLMVLEVSRHGAREPLNDYWNAGEFHNWGELTGVGMRQHYNLGKNLRSIYVEQLGFLSKTFDPLEFYVRSTDYNRTLQSATSQLYGFYPLGYGPQIPPNLNPIYENPPFLSEYLRKEHHKNALPNAFQPIPIHTLPSTSDKLLLPFHTNCSIINIYDQKILNSSYYQELNDRYRNNTFVEVGKLVDLTDEEIQTLNIDDVSNIYDVFVCDIYADKAIPKHMTNDLWKNLTFINAEDSFYYLTGMKEILQFYVTPFYEEIIRSFSKKLAGDKLKWKMFIAHDTTLTVFSAGLNLTDYQCIEEKILTGKTNRINCVLNPDFAANLLVELHKIDENEYIMIRYNGEYMNMCGKRETRCLWDEFKIRMENFMVDYDLVCNSDGLFTSKSNLVNKIHLRNKKNF